MGFIEDTLVILITQVINILQYVYILYDIIDARSFHLYFDNFRYFSSWAAGFSSLKNYSGTMKSITDWYNLFFLSRFHYRAQCLNLLFLRFWEYWIPGMCQRITFYRSVCISFVLSVSKLVI